MIEKHIVVEDIDPVALYGVNNANMQIIKALYPKLRKSADEPEPLPLPPPACMPMTGKFILSIFAPPYSTPPWHSTQDSTSVSLSMRSVTPTGR